MRHFPDPYLADPTGSQCAHPAWSTESVVTWNALGSLRRFVDSLVEFSLKDLPPSARQAVDRLPRVRERLDSLEENLRQCPGELSKDAILRVLEDLSQRILTPISRRRAEAADMERTWTEITRRAQDCGVILYSPSPGGWWEPLEDWIDLESATGSTTSRNQRHCFIHEVIRPYLHVVGLGTVHKGEAVIRYTRARSDSAWD